MKRHSRRRNIFTPRIPRRRRSDSTRDLVNAGVGALIGLTLVGAAVHAFKDN